MAKKQRGRPPKAVDDKREDRLDLRVSTAEKREFKLAAEKSQQELSVWIRIQLHKATEEELTPIETLHSTTDRAENVEQNKSSANRIGSV